MCGTRRTPRTEARVTKTGEVIRERVQGATAATATAVGRAERVLDDAGEAAQPKATQQAWSEVADNPFIGCAIGYVAGWWNSRTTVDQDGRGQPSVCQMRLTRNLLGLV